MPIPIPVLGAVSYEAIRAVKTVSGNASVPRMFRSPEHSALTTQIGVPLKLNGGFLDECTFVAADVIFGVSGEPGHNLTTSGVAKQESEYTPPNQPNAVITPVGAHVRDGNIGNYAADGLNVFSIALKAGQTFTPALIIAGTYYGLTKDGTSGFWYLDTGVTAGNSAVAALVGYDTSSPNDGVNGTRVYFQFKSGQRYFV